MNRLRELRQKHKYSQTQLAALVNVHQTAVSQWELGKSIPDIETLIKLSEVYGVSIDYLLGRDETASHSQHVDDDEALEYLDELHKRPEIEPHYFALLVVVVGVTV